MLLRSLYLMNYAGIFNGMGLNEIYIDFTKCKNRIILIRGDNGSGKSTLEKTMKPLPDNNNEFIPQSKAIKKIEYFDEYTGDLYSIQFIHECKPNGDRCTAKGYIKKTSNGITTELNPNGNITSCKDIIFDELKLDPNYIALSQLSSLKRGLADMRPFERKKYVNTILSSTEAYNNIYKKLSKKSIAYKGLMNSIVSKLDSISDSGKLKMELSSTEDVISKMTQDNKTAIKMKASAEGSIQEIDPTGNFIRELDEYNNRMIDIIRDIENIDNQLSSYTNIDNPNDYKIFIQNKINELQTNKKIYSSKLDTIIQNREIEATELQTKTAKLVNLNQGTSYNQLTQIKSKCETRMFEIKNRLNFINIDNITRDEFVLGINTLNDIIDSVKGYTGSIDYGIFNDVLNDTHPNQLQDISICKQNKESIISKIFEYENQLSKLEAKEELIKELDNRPKECKVDTCPYIIKSVEAFKSFNKDDILNIQQNMYKFNEELNTIDSTLEYLEEYNKAKLFITNIFRQINSTKSILYKLPIKELLSDNIQVIRSIFNNETLEAMNRLYSYLDEANDIEEYKTLEREYNNTINQLNNLNSQAEFIDLLEKDISRIQTQLDNDIKELDNLNTEISNIDIKLVKLEDELSKVSTIIELMDKRNSLSNEKDNISKLLQIHNEKITKINQYKAVIDKCNNVIAKTENELTPLNNKRSNIVYQLNLIDQYNKELNEYKSMYDKIEVLKYHSSTATGIQLLFSEMYLEHTRIISNEILQHLFNGKFALMQFVISGEDFSMPVAVDGGLNHNDISNMSSAEVTLLSMIISISLLSQTSTKLNIIVGDEIDGPFDSDNRREFFNILYQLMNIVHSSQCVLISHNSELNQNDCDVILLKNDNGDGPNCQGNVIWSYYDV